MAWMKPILLMTFGALVILLAYAGMALAVANRLTRTSCHAPGSPFDGLPLPPPTYVHYLSRDGRARVAASLHAAAAPRGAIVLVHGRGGSRSHPLWSHLADLIAIFLERGFSVLAIDLRGHGGSSPARLSFGLHERHDVLGAVDWLVARGYAPGTIGLLGASMGGAASIAAAAEEPAVGALVADSSFADFRAVAREGFRLVFPFPGHGLLFAGVLAAAAWLTRARLAGFSPAALAARLTQPLLVVHSIGDPLVPWRHALALADAAHTNPWLTHSPGHLGSFLACPDEYVRRLLGFFEQHLGENAGLTTSRRRRLDR